MKRQGKASRTSWPPPYIVQPKVTHTHTFILLHGLGSNGEKFGSELLASGISSEGNTLADAFPGAKFIFPIAKWRRSTAFNRAVITQWFDFYSLKDRTPREEIQMDGLADSTKYIRSIIGNEMELLPATKIALGGISQGCATSLIVLLSLEFSIGAYVGMSGRLPFCRDMNRIINFANGPNDGIVFGDKVTEKGSGPTAQVLDFVRDLLDQDAVDSRSPIEHNALATPIFIGHGAKDDKVPRHLGEEASSILSTLGMVVTWKVYPELGHWYQVPDEIDDISVFLHANLE